VAGGFEDAPGAAGDEQLREELLDLDRFLGALTRLVLPDVVGELEIDGGRESGAQPRGLEHVRHEMDRRGLAIGPGHADELQLPRRVIEELGGQVRERGARVRHHSDRHPRRHRVLRHDRDRAARHRVGGEVVPVAVEPRDRDEERALLHPA